MKYIFNKISVTHKVMGLPTNVIETNDQIIIDFSKHTVKEITKGVEQENIWPFDEVLETHIDGIYKLSVTKGYWNDWNFKPKNLKEKVVVFLYMHKDNIVKFIKGIMSIAS